MQKRLRFKQFKILHKSEKNVQICLPCVGQVVIEKRLNLCPRICLQQTVGFYLSVCIAIEVY